MMHRFAICTLVALGAAAGQAPAPNPLKLGNVTLAGSLRTRIEMWDWFQGEANNHYTYPGSIFRLSLAQSKRQFDWQLEFAVPFLLGLPNDAIAPGNQGQLGMGASYFAATRKTNAAMLFAKQGFIRFKALGGRDGHTLRLGRMDMTDGTEVTPKNATLAAVKRDRVAQRLLGNFGFTHVGRSFDGVQYALNGSKLNFTAFGGRPTRGVFQVDGWGELNINVYYGALTGQAPGKNGSGEWRLFGLGYSDYRDGVLKTDSRPLAARRADGGHVHIGTFGGHYIHTVQSRAGVFDALFWGVLQAGSWGRLDHRAGAFVLEGGWQPPVLPKLKPWLRGGYDYGSGDKNPNDNTHGTFFQVMPTPRVYARFPFFNMMNTRDAFGELIVRPHQSVVVRGDVHTIRLSSSSDLSYVGGGAFQPWTFGYIGRTSGGQTGLATLYDASADYNIGRHYSIGVYLGHAQGKLVMQSIYPKGRNGNFGFVELGLKF